MADEKIRVTTFSTVEIDDGDWDGPHRDEDVMSYKSRNNTASIRVTRDGTAVIDGDYTKGKTIYIVDDVIHLPEGLVSEIG